MHVQAIHQSIYAKNAVCRETEVAEVGDRGVHISENQSVMMMMTMAKCRAAGLSRQSYTRS